MTRLLATLAFSAFATLAISPAEAHDDFCATYEQKANIARYYTKLRPGVPVPVASRFFNLKEAVVASALPPEMRTGAIASSEVAEQVWKSIEEWGADTNVMLVFAPNGRHAFAFPSKIPIDQNDSSDGYLDVYADEGRGVHSHIQLDDVAFIRAQDAPFDDEGHRTRGISFYSKTGDLIIGVYASIRSKDADSHALSGFAKTWALIDTMPSACN